ncbi:MAG: hypothetical protein CML60_10465 [Rhodobacteraceae bacterium]|nr:hypothetical protein [Paracoccaceae bacterium]MBT26801.1 hypothetical protein [Paracoccaceae bacterium]
MSVRVIEPGWLYVLTNPAMPGLCKIGMTTRTPEERATELHDTGSPAPYAVAAAWPVDDVRAAERDAHAALARYRVSYQREWFRVSVPAAIAALGRDNPLDQPCFCRCVGSCQSMPSFDTATISRSVETHRCSVSQNRVTFVR